MHPHPHKAGPKMPSRWKVHKKVTNAVYVLSRLWLKTETNGDSRSTYERGLSFVGSIGSSCPYKRFFSWLVCSCRHRAKYFVFIVHYFTSCVPIALQACQAVVPRRLSPVVPWDIETGDPARRPAQVAGHLAMGTKNMKKCSVRKIIFCTGLTSAAKSGQNALVPAWGAQRTNQGRTPFICSQESPPRLPQFQQSAGASPVVRFKVLSRFYISSLMLCKYYDPTVYTRSGN